MGTVVATFARTRGAAAGYAVSDTGEIMADGAVVFRAPVTSGDRTSDAAYFDLVTWIGTRCVDRLDPVAAYADAIEINTLSALGLAVKSAPTLRDSLRRVERYFLLVTDTVRYRLEEAESRALFRIERRTAQHPAHDLRNECALAAFARSMTRFGGAGVGFEHVVFRHACSGDPDGYAAWFGCPLLFDGEADAIALRREVLETPNRSGGARVSNFVTAHLDERLGRLTTAPTVAEIL